MILERRSDRPFVIRDPVHGYLSVAAHERLIVDAPITQRLRRIGQTGLAELVFPAAKTSRFVHSLGAMHLASRFFIAALENGSREHVSSFLEEIWLEVDDIRLREGDLDELLRHSGTLNALLTPRFSGKFDFSPPRGHHYRRLMAVTEGAVRLAALFHDLGHLPFSHDLEYALKDYASNEDFLGRAMGATLKKTANAKAPHEEIGHALADIVFRSIQTELPADTAVYALAKKILDAPSSDSGVLKYQRASALQWLHSLVDGEIDVDRADYLMRDGEALGLDFAQYDLDRLVANLNLVHTPELGYITAVKESGLAALESYCVTRSRSHQVFVRHHKVCQVGAALRHASAQLFGMPEAAPLLSALDGLGEEHELAERNDALQAYAALDDGWWFQGMRSLQRSTTIPFTKACCNLVLDRAPSLRSVWKRKGELGADKTAFLRDYVQSVTKPKDGALKLQSTRRRLLQHNVLISTFNFRPFLTEAGGHSVMKIMTKSGGLQPASMMSPLIKHLQDVWNEDIHLFAFAELGNNISSDEVIEMLTSDSENISTDH